MSNLINNENVPQDEDVIKLQAYVDELKQEVHATRYHYKTSWKIDMDISIYNKQIETVALRQKEYLKKAKQSFKNLEFGIKQFEEELSFFDTFLFGWFGNKECLISLKKMHQLLDKISSIIEQLKSNYTSVLITKIQTIEQKNIEVYLANHDYDYIHLTKAKDKLITLNRKLYQVVTLADNTLSAINEAQTMETVDILTDNRGIELYSTLSTNDASNMIRNFQDEVRQFNSSLCDDIDMINSFDFLEGMLDLDVGLDLLFGFMNLSNLNSAESDIESIRNEYSQEIQSTHKELSQISTTLETKIRRYKQF
jgi:hypothetical protein